MAQAIGFLIGQIVGAAIGALIAAFIVQFAANFVVKFKPPYGMAYKAAFLGYVASFIVGFVIGFFVTASGNQTSGAVVVLVMVMGFLIQAYLYGILLKSPDDRPIGFNKGLIISLVQLLAASILIGIIVGIVSVFS